MANYEKPTVQFRPRNKAEARQWRRDRAQLRYERNWKRTSKTHNPLTGKKNYSAPKAEIYQSKDLQKSQTQYRKGNRSYRPTPRFGGTVFGLVSLILLIGILGTAFLAVQNNGRKEGEPFVYFSPSDYLNGISSGKIVVPADDYTVRLELSYFPIISDFFEPQYYGYLDVGGRSYKSKSAPYEYAIQDGSAVFRFDIDGTEYTSRAEELQGPTIDGEPLGYLFVVTLPEKVYSWNEQPDLNVVVRAWNDIDSSKFYDGFADALVTTAQFVGDYFVYQGNLLVALMPWNSVRSSDAVPADGAKIDIPWRDNDQEIVTGVITDIID